MSWVKLVVLGTSLFISAVTIGVAAYQKRQQNRLRPNPGHTYAYQTEKKKRKCGICLKEMNSSEEITLPCGHKFCSKCLTPLYLGTQTTCCECRKELNTHELMLLKRRLELN